MTLSQLLTQIRTLISEPVERYFDDDELTRFVNRAYFDFVNYAQPCEKIRAFVGEANKQTIDLPTECLTIERLNFEEQYPILAVDETEFRLRLYQAPHTNTSRPYMYTQYPAYGTASQLQIWPGFSTASATTTVSGALSAAATTIPCASTTSFPTQGFVVIETEQIRYWNKDATNFLICERGHGYTTAATHANLTTITYAPLQLFFRYTPPELSVTTDSPRLPEAWQEALIQYSVGNALQKRGEMPQADRFFQNYNRIREEAKLVRERQQIDRPVMFMSDHPADILNWTI